MWINVKLNAAVSIDNLKTQFGNNLTEDEFNAIISLDITTNLDRGIGGKYCPWLFRLYQKNDFSLNQASSIRDAIDYFERNKRRFEKKDIGQYKTMSEFLQTVDTVADTPLSDRELAKQKKKQVHNAGDQDKKLLAKDGEFELWTPLTHEGSISLAQAGGVKARWCTAYNGDDRYYKYYTEDGPLYIFINTANPSEKYQSCPAAESWFFNIDDKELGEHSLLVFLAQHPAIASVFCRLVPELDISDPSDLRYVDGCVIAGSELLGADSSEHLVVPEGVTSIGDYVFNESSSLTSISIPDSVTSIGESAFQRCFSLSEVWLPDNLLELSDFMFSGCKSLALIHLPKRLNKIGQYSFAACSSLTSISIPDSVTSIKTCAFYNCESLTEVYLPDTLRTIARDAFHSCTSLKTVYCKTDRFDEYFAKLGATVIHDTPDSDSWEDVDKLDDYL